MIQRIAITGPESTGKSYLAEQLAKHYNAAWVPEYAREYLTRLGRPYDYNDILVIARKQYALNHKKWNKNTRFVFCDTELIVTCIWCKIKYGKCHPWIVDHIPVQQFNLYLLTDIDLPWEPDPLREHPDLREQLMKMYIDELEQRKLPYRIISGSKKQRLLNAIEVINNLQ